MGSCCQGGRNRRTEVCAPDEASGSRHGTSLNSSPVDGDPKYFTVAGSTPRPTTSHGSSHDPGEGPCDGGPGGDGPGDDACDPGGGRGSGGRRYLVTEIVSDTFEVYGRSEAAPGGKTGRRKTGAAKGVGATAEGVGAVEGVGAAAEGVGAAAEGVGAAAEGVEGVAVAKGKGTVGGHQCDRCELTCHPVEADLQPLRSGGVWIPDLVHVRQSGPFCAAAVVAATLQSIGLERGAPRLCAVTRDDVISFYIKFGVENVDKTTALVTNEALMSALTEMCRRVTGNCMELSVAELRITRGAEGVGWKYVKGALDGGVRIVYHMRNHYSRVFGYRIEGATGEQQLLTARRGQRPKHWVPWKDIHRDVSTHRHHMLVSVEAI